MWSAGVAVLSMGGAAAQGSFADSFGDGTPDFLRLDQPADREVFRTWFTFLAEAQFDKEPSKLPQEISDCGALVRFAYREALRRHDGGWAREVDLDRPAPAGSVRKYNYPFTALGAGLFRVREGPAASSFAQFADAGTLRRWNTFFLSRRLEAARPGDLLFYDQTDAQMPAHVMIVLEGHVVYHTGPPQGEVRRPSIEELLRHRQPRWRPVVGNPYFLGVYRWNILRD